MIRLGPYKFSPTLIPTLATIVLVGLFVSLGNWQLNRAEYKQIEQNKRALNMKLIATAIKPTANCVKKQLNEKNDDDRQLKSLEEACLKEMLGRKTVTRGRFDTAHEAVLSYQKYKGQPGFLVLTPFIIEGTEVRLLVLRGWIAQSYTRGFTKLPEIPKSEKGKILLYGVVDKIQTVKQLSNKPDGRFVNQWPKILNYASLDWYSKQLKSKFMVYVVKQNFQNAPGLIVDWKEFSIQREYMTPERHSGYAFMWLSMALVLLVLYGSLNLSRTGSSTKESPDKS